HEGLGLDCVTYVIEVLPAAARELRKVHPQMQARIRGAVLTLAVEPRPPGARALKDRPGYLRVHVGDYRIIYTLQDDVLRVIVVRFGHRRDIYR
ncbi:MAG: mRNA interferase RelE/StbE, partial [Actinomycetota bacterium]|nr:mRNA interferase RelE/StbE [Actinomycetota bacterium]